MLSGAAALSDTVASSGAAVPSSMVLSSGTAPSSGAALPPGAVLSSSVEPPSGVAPSLGTSAPSDGSGWEGSEGPGITSLDMEASGTVGSAAPPTLGSAASSGAASPACASIVPPPTEASFDTNTSTVSTLGAVPSCASACKGAVLASDAENAKPAITTQPRRPHTHALPIAYAPLVSDNRRPTSSAKQASTTTQPASAPTIQLSPCHAVRESKVRRCPLRTTLRTYAHQHPFPAPQGGPHP